jgi:hypothetical protein
MPYGALCARSEAAGLEGTRAEMVQFSRRDRGQPVTVAMRCARRHSIDEPGEVVPAKGPPLTSP